MLPMIDRQTECDSASKTEKVLESQGEGVVESIKEWSQPQEVSEHNISESMTVPGRESKPNEDMDPSGVQLIDYKQSGRVCCATGGEMLNLISCNSG
eukprot:293985-Hanusia_phi.AAC.4